MRLYPDVTPDRVRAVLLDVLVLAGLWACLSVGQAVHHSISELDVLGRGVERAGTQVRDAFDDAGDRVDGAPVVGDDLEEALGSAGQRTAEPVVRAGVRGRQAVADLADLLAWIAGGIPALVLLVWFLPRRVARARQLTAATRVFAAAAADDERRHLLAMRAAFDLPFATLLRYTKDPLGDLHARRLDPLLRAIAEEHGLRLAPARPADAPRS